MWADRMACLPALALSTHHLLERGKQAELVLFLP